MSNLAGLEPSLAGRPPRAHDLRHTFAVKTLLGWYRAGDEVAARTPLLSTYLGHVDPVATYWYVSATPELLGLAAQRLESASEGPARDGSGVPAAWAGGWPGGGRRHISILRDDR